MRKKRVISVITAIIALGLVFSPGTLTASFLMPVTEAGTGSGSTAREAGPLDFILNPLAPLLEIDLFESGLGLDLKLLDFLELRLGLSQSEKLELGLRLQDFVDIDLSLMDLLENPEIVAAITRATIEAKGFRKIHTIQYPLSTLPEIVKAGEDLLIELREDPGHASEIKITLTPSFAGSAEANAITLKAREVTTAPSQYWVGEYAREVHSIRVEVPCFEEEPRLQECLYDLEVAWDGGYDSQGRAVKVIKEYKENFNYIVMADVHVGFEIHDPSRDSIGEFKKAIEEINLLNPEFVLLCGDIVCAQSFPGQYGLFGVDNPEQELWIGHEYETFYHYLQMFEVPVYLVPGNHDGYTQTIDDGREYWQAMIGPFYYSFDYDDTHFTGVDTYQWSQLDRLGASLLVSAWGGQIGEEQLEWLRGDLEANRDKEIVLFAHHSPNWPEESWPGRMVFEDILQGLPVIEQLVRGIGDLPSQYWTGAGRQELLDICNEYGVSAYFAGHRHIDEIETDPKNAKTLYVETTALRDGYRYIDVEDNRMARFTYDDEKSSLPVSELNITYQDAGCESGTAEVTNDLDQDFQGAKVRLPVPKGEDQWRVAGDFEGEIHNVFEGEHGNEVEVLFDLPANSSGQVFLEPADAEPPQDENGNEDQDDGKDKDKDDNQDGDKDKGKEDDQDGGKDGDKDGGQDQGKDDEDVQVKPELPRTASAAGWPLDIRWLVLEAGLLLTGIRLYYKSRESRKKR